MNLRLSSALALLAVTSLVLAACGSSNDNSTTTSAGSTSNSTAATVDVAQTDIGKALVGPNGHTLYKFDKDKPNKSNCSGDCAAAWPPLTSSGSATAGAGVSASKLGATSGSQAQVTYDGHPLYYYAGDQQPGQTNGQKSDQFGAEWYALSPSGEEIEKANPTASTNDKGSGDSSGDSSGGSGGYSY